MLTAARLRAVSSAGLVDLTTATNMVGRIAGGAASNFGLLNGQSLVVDSYLASTGVTAGAAVPRT